MQQHCILSLFSILLASSDHQILRLAVLLLLLIALLQPLDTGIPYLISGHGWRIAVPATTCTNVDDGRLTLHWDGVCCLIVQLLASMSCGLSLHVLSRHEFLVSDWSLKSIIVDIHLGTDN